MAEPTLKDVLNALAALEKGQAELRADVARVDAKVEAHRKETAKGFADLDEELETHTKKHNDIDRKLAAVSKKPARPAARAPRRR